MKALGTFGVMLLVFSVLGCEAQECDNAETGADGICLKSLDRFEGETQTIAAAYTVGTNVSIDSLNGNVRVVAGSGADVNARFKPFVFRAFDTPEEQIMADLADLTLSAVGDANGVFVDVDRADGALNTLGADVTVELPSTFDGVLSIDQTNGQTDVDFVAAAVGVVVDNNNGSCDVVTGSASSVSVNTGNGTITLTFPADGVFNVQAQAMAGGVVQNNLAGCAVVEGSTASAMTISCNGATSADPVYSAVADGTSLADVVLSF
jgi:hypothetical protein